MKGPQALLPVVLRLPMASVVPLVLRAVNTLRIRLLPSVLLCVPWLLHLQDARLVFLPPVSCIIVKLEGVIVNQIVPLLSCQHG